MIASLFVMDKPKKTVPVLDLFSGCGGLSLGLELAEHQQLKLKTVAAIDNWKIACETYAHNLGLEPLCSDINSGVIQSALAGKAKPDVIVGGPPCQGFSTSGKRALDDPRNSLINEFLDAVRNLSPKVFVMENVSGFKSFQGGLLLEEATRLAEELGYQVHTMLLQASHFGVPQRRRRFFMIGAKCSYTDLIEEFTGISQGPAEALFSFEPKQHYDVALDPSLESWTFGDATSDLPSIGAGESASEYKSAPVNDIQRYFRSAKKNYVADHTARGHRPGFVEMMSYIPQGKSALDPEINKQIPPKIRPGKGFPNSYSRIRFDLPSPTITRNFTTPSSANCIHPLENRALSLREGARLQTFPDHYTFLGSIDEKRLQIGNAVPPLLAKKIGELIANLVSRCN